MNTYYGKEGRQKVWDLIKDIKIASMATYDTKKPILHARPMMAQQEEFNGVLWFFTGADSRKVAEIKKNPYVLLSYSHPDHQNYVTLSGHAEVMRDQEKINELWNEMARTWFPEGKDDPNLMLIRFQAEEAEFWDAPSSAFVHAYGYVKALLTGEMPHPAETGRVDYLGGMHSEAH